MALTFLMVCLRIFVSEYLIKLNSLILSSLLLTLLQPASYELELKFSQEKRHMHWMGGASVQQVGEIRVNGHV